MFLKIILIFLFISGCNNSTGFKSEPRSINPKKIGIEHVESLEGPQEPKRYRHEEILAIKAKYKLLTKELTIKLEGAA